MPADEGRWIVCRKKITSPAVTLEFLEQNKRAEILSVDIVPALEVPQGWPEAARAGPDVDNWLGKNNRRKILGQPVYFVPKRPKERSLTPVEKGPTYERRTTLPVKSFLISCINNFC